MSKCLIRNKDEIIQFTLLIIYWTITFLCLFVAVYSSAMDHRSQIKYITNQMQELVKSIWTQTCHYWDPFFTYVPPKKSQYKF